MPAAFTWKWSPNDKKTMYKSFLIGADDAQYF